MTWILMMLVAAWLCGMLLLRLRVPGGVLVGAIVGSMAVHLITGRGHLDVSVRVFAQVVTGAYVGCTLTADNAKRMPNIIGPYLVNMLSFLVMNLAVGFLFFKITNLDLLTALLSACPGGVSDMPLIAMDLGAEASIVALMQFTRMIFGLSAIPAVILLAGRGNRIKTAASQSEPLQCAQEKPVKKEEVPLHRMLPAFILAGIAGTLGRVSGIPAGAMILSMVTAGAMKLAGYAHAMPIWIRRCAQVLSGCCIGASITMDQLLAMRHMLLPILILMAAYTLICVGMGHVVSRVFHIGLDEAMLALAPAGASEMALIAADMGIESGNVMVLQLCRLVGVIAIFPQIFILVVKIYG